MRGAARTRAGSKTSDGDDYERANPRFEDRHRAPPAQGLSACQRSPGVRPHGTTGACLRLHREPAPSAGHRIVSLDLGAQASSHGSATRRVGPPPGGPGAGFAAYPGRGPDPEGRRSGLAGGQGGGSHHGIPPATATGYRWLHPWPDPNLGWDSRGYRRRSRRAR